MPAPSLCGLVDQGVGADLPQRLEEGWARPEIFGGFAVRWDGRGGFMVVPFNGALGRTGEPR
jgi:hypothetical protein